MDDAGATWVSTLKLNEHLTNGILTGAITVKSVTLARDPCIDQSVPKLMARLANLSDSASNVANECLLPPAVVDLDVSF